MKITPDMIDLSSVDVMFGITRWCNMQCPHCMRGDRQKIRIKKEYIDAVLTNFDDSHISCLMVTGGEPALAIDLIEYIKNYLQWHNITLGSFWLATNGSVTSQKFFDLIEDLFWYTDEPELNGIRVSIDNYHDQINKEKWEDFEYRLQRGNIQYDGAPSESKLLLAEGRAEQNYYTTRKVSNSLSLGDDGRVDGTLYVTERGNIVSTCDISYERADNIKSPFYVCRVEENLKQGLADFFNRHPEHVDKNFKMEAV